MSSRQLVDFQISKEHVRLSTPQVNFSYKWKGMNWLSCAWRRIQGARGAGSRGEARRRFPGALGAGSQNV